MNVSGQSIQFFLNLEPQQDTEECFFCSCDPDLDPMTLIYKSDLKILKMYQHIKNKPSSSRLSKVRTLQAN